MENIKSIIISRTDNLGDVLLTLPICGILKSLYPDLKIHFLGKSYTKSLITKSKFVDEFIDREDVLAGKYVLNADAIVHVFPDKEIAKIALKSKINIRIGTSHRWFHWFTCNRLVNLTRKTSSLHETQLNIKLLAPLGLTQDFDLSTLYHYYGFDSKKTHANENQKRKIILHPKSKGSAREWELAKYFELAKQLDKSKYEVFVTGTKQEGEKIIAEIPDFFDGSGAIDKTGQFSLDQLIDFIESADALVACSTGPLHIAAAVGIHAVGFYPSIKPMHAGRWQPLGKFVKIFALDKNCTNCAKSNYCSCINSFEVAEVLSYLGKI